MPCRTGRIVVYGSVGTANITAGGTSDVYLKTVNETANINLGGTANAFIGARARMPAQWLLMRIHVFPYVCA
jgi:hypothetical protein